MCTLAWLSWGNAAKIRTKWRALHLQPQWADEIPWQKKTGWWTNNHPWRRVVRLHSPTNWYFKNKRNMIFLVIIQSQDKVMSALFPKKFWCAKQYSLFSRCVLKYMNYYLLFYFTVHSRACWSILFLFFSPDTRLIFVRMKECQFESKGMEIPCSKERDVWPNKIWMWATYTFLINISKPTFLLLIYTKNQDWSFCILLVVNGEIKTKLIQRA